jgi:hypothetical protein
MAVAKEDFCNIASAFAIPASFFTMVDGGETVLMKQQGRGPNGDMSRGCKKNPPKSSATTDLLAAILAQNTLSTKTKFSMSVTYNSKKKLTLVFVHGPDADEVAAMIDEVNHNMQNIALPTFIVTLFLTQRVRSAVEKIKDSHHSISDVENHTGVKTIWHPGKACCEDRNGKKNSKDRLYTIDFDKVTNELTSILSRMAYCEFVCNVHLPMLDDVDAINAHIAGPSIDPNAAITLALRSLRADNEFLKSSLKGVLTRSKYLSKRAQASVQTVRMPCSSDSTHINCCGAYRSSV